ncbi:pectinesterase [Prunus yedoensis var. nudiflora]|uniref:Pectinesterase n=1 Tax=Prunus yedoensis var. nudiflora TaxID=2094558 RepID=A0A314YQ86_PRUYE|nr:pectinesterase [Prunus yedoensis var. nudiflora]
MLTFVVFWALGGASVLGAGQANDSYQIYVQKECSFTRYPSICVQTMTGSGLGHDQQHVDIMLALANKTISETMLATSEFVNFSSQFKLGGKLGAREAQLVHSVKDYYCEELMNMSLKRLDQSLLALKQSPRKNKRDIQAWLSAALTFQDTCKDYSSGQISKRIDNASQLVSNLLALVNRIASNHTATVTNHRNVDQGLFAKWVSRRDRKLLQATAIKADAVVAKDGSGN